MPSKSRITTDGAPAEPRASKAPPRHTPERTAATRPAPAPLPPAIEAPSPKPSDLADRVGTGMAAFEDIIVPTAAQRTAVRQMDSLRIMGLRQALGTDLLGTARRSCLIHERGRIDRPHHDFSSRRGRYAST